jgi:hypothetical protein
MKRYSFRIVIAGLKDDVLRLFENNPALGQKALSTVNDPANGIANNMKLLAAWCMLNPAFTLQSVKYVIEHIVSEKLNYKILLSDKSLVITSNSEEKPFRDPVDLAAYLDSQIRTSQQVSTKTDIEPIMQSPDGKIKIFQVTGEFAPQIAQSLAGDTTWCITKPASGMYYSYRFGKGSTFYFVFDENMEGTSLEKVAIDFPKFTFDPVLGVFPVKRVDLTDLSNRTGPNLTANIPGVKGRNWNAYQSYLQQNGIDVDEKDENGAKKLRNIPITPQEKEEHEILKESIPTLEGFLDLLKGDNLRNDLAKKYIARSHALTFEQWDWLINNPNQITFELLSQYISSSYLIDHQIEDVKKFPKLLKRLRGVVLNTVEQHKVLEDKYKSIFTPDELRQIYLKLPDEGISFFPKDTLTDEEIIAEFDKDPEKFIQNISSNKRFDFLKPEILEKILQLSQTKNINLLLFPYKIFFPNATMSDLAAYISKFPDCNIGTLAIPLDVLLNPKFIRLLIAHGFTGWYKMFTESSNFIRGRGLSVENVLLYLFKQDMDLILHFPKSILKKYGIETSLATNAPDLAHKILANPEYADRFNLPKLYKELRLTEQGKNNNWIQRLPSEALLYEDFRTPTQIDEGQTPEVPQDNQDNQDNNQNPMVGIMKKLDDSGMYDVADKVQNYWKRTVDKTKESLDKLS